jgi:metabolite-proton symporter
MRPTAVQPRRERRALVEAVIASTIGTTIEWYDFFLYGIATAIVFRKLFFPELAPFAGQIASLSTFTIGFIARPIGGLIFGYLGDRVGRKSTLVATLLLMGMSTLLVGFVPTYEQIGLAAPVLLTVLRIIQGIGVGGEWGGAVLLALEYAHRGKRGFFASWPQAGVPLGLLMSTGAVALLRSNMTEQAFLDWGWRVPFYLSGLLILIGLLIRLRILETPLFAELKEKNQLAKAPVSEAIRRHWREILLGCGTRITEQSCFYLFSIYILDYAEAVLHMEGGLILWVVNGAAGIEFFTIPLFGFLSDRLSRKGVYVIGCLFLICFAWPYYALLWTRSPAWIAFAIILSLAVGHALVYSVQASLIPELFGTRLRYTGASLSYQLASVVAGGPAPLIAASLVKAFPQQYLPLVIYIVLISIVSLVCVQLLSETSGKDIRTSD